MNLSCYCQESSQQIGDQQTTAQVDNWSYVDCEYYCIINRSHVWYVSDCFKSCVGSSSLDWGEVVLGRESAKRAWNRNYKSKTKRWHKTVDCHWRSNSTRGNSCKLKKNHILNIGDANMFHNRVINFWNKLPDSVVLAASISSFKRLLLSFVVNVGFERFFCQLDFFLCEVLSFKLLLLLTLFLWAPVSGGCILPWCSVQCLFCIWTNKLIDDCHSITATV